MRSKIALLVMVALLSMAFVVTAVPVSGTVHEITGMLCSFNGEGGNAVLNPPGISGENGASDRGALNLARPLFASGFATFDPSGGPGGTALISFDEDHPASKIELTGTLFELEPGLWVTAFTFTNGSWRNCQH